MRTKLFTNLIFTYFIATSFTVYAQSWQQQNSGTFSDMSNINFFDNNTGWAFGDSTIGLIFKEGIILKTTNQGVNWTPQNMGTDSIKILSSYIFSSTQIIAVGKFQTTGNGASIMTTNGGVTWSRDTTSFPERLFDVDFISANVGWVSGRTGYIGMTNNLGNTWNTLTTGTGEDIFSIDFIDANNGWAVGADPGTGGTILHTIDGGLNWTPQVTTSVGDLFAVYVFNSTSAIAVGAGGVVITTNDGTTWVTQTSGTTNDLADVDFIDANNGWAAGGAGTIIKTTDSGTNWLGESSNTINDISSIDRRAVNLGWYAGKQGDIYRFGFPVGVEDSAEKNSEIQVFPNPSSENTTFILDNNIEKFKIELFDVLGKEVKTIEALNTNKIVLERKNLNNGIYFFNIYIDDNKVDSGKIILN